MEAQFRIVVEFVRHKLDHDTEFGLWPLLYWAVCARSEKFKGEHHLDDPVLSACSSLFIIVDDYNSPAIHFTHFSAKGSIQGRNALLKQRMPSCFRVSMTRALIIIAQVCLRTQEPPT